ncbi:hypothetical protein SAMN05660772_00929 [Pasteurella testudinis DSM 23072]|uniref:Uncharacterized protein n=1 Tax=Pasteurella testudinis DSM 23072 TaxID=1122938 RepID=A0A1W1V088_9PAST|nr:hypothetical protein SAMN05660772_00929 [Pasteurella testudinis DSM 23072]SUB51848.1 Uncharacterised protein [Pasteurella testudinis]
MNIDWIAIIKSQLVQLKPLFIFLIVILTIAAILIRLKQKNVRYLPSGNLYRKTTVLNKTEKQLFYKLRLAFPAWHIFVQVPFSCIVTPKQTFLHSQQRLFWRINQNGWIF